MPCEVLEYKEKSPKLSRIEGCCQQSPRVLNNPEYSSPLLYNVSQSSLPKPVATHIGDLVNYERVNDSSVMFLINTMEVISGCLTDQME